MIYIIEIQQKIMDLFETSYDITGNSFETTIQPNKQSFKNESDYLDQFLDQLALCKENVKQQKNDEEPLHDIVEPDRGVLDKNETLILSKKKSLFHNFQKHLISILRRYFKITTRSFGQNQHRQLAYSLWHSFLKTQSCSKHILHLIFGMRVDRLMEEQLKELANKFKSFQRIWNQNNFLHILKAQQLIRQVVVKQSKLINKQLLEANCHIHKFQVFYLYFNSFFDELAQGPMARRLSKVRISLLMQKLKY